MAVSLVDSLLRKTTASLLFCQTCMNTAQRNGSKQAGLATSPRYLEWEARHYSFEARALQSIFFVKLCGKALASGVSKLHFSLFSLQWMLARVSPHNLSQFKNTCPPLPPRLFRVLKVMCTEAFFQVENAIENRCDCSGLGHRHRTDFASRETRFCDAGSQAQP